VRRAEGGRLVRVMAVVGMAFGAMSVVAGTRVLAGVDRPDYVVLPWLVAYNVAAGAAGVVVGAGIWLWRGWGATGASVLAGAHAAVLGVLVGMRLVGESVATDSLGAMLLRSVVWLAIAGAARRLAGGR
jgi:hypothetical protein